jgi:hypothetical protein
MTAKRSSKARKGASAFEERLLSAAKVIRVLKEMDVDPKAFQEAYERDTTRGTAGPRKPTEGELAAAARFQQDGNLDALMSAVGTANPQTALAKVGRVLQWKAQQR